MYTKEEWIKILDDVNTMSFPYSEMQKKYARYAELENKKNNIKENTGWLINTIYIVTSILGFVKLGWIKGFIALFVLGILDEIIQKLIVQKRLEKKLMAFEEQYGEEMKSIEQQMPDMEKQLEEIKKSESYLAVSKEGILYAYRSLDDRVAMYRRSEIKNKLESNEAQTLEEAVKMMEADHR